MRRLAFATLLCLSSKAFAHQPVMDMAPRWADGYGVQTRVEHFDSQTTTWFEGVYTWDRSIRGTFKLPYSGGEVGDLILGLPLKKYRNEGARTANWSITPSIQFPRGRVRTRGLLEPAVHLVLRAHVVRGFFAAFVLPVLQFA